MQNALYPKRFDDVCPYCGSTNILNPLNFAGTTEEISVQRHCDDCGRSHRLNYQVTSVTLENSDGMADTDFYYPVAELQEQGVDDPGQTPTIPVGIIAGPDGIMLMAAGYGDRASTPGYGAPVIIEQYEGKLRVVVWDDINDDDASQIIELGGARYSEEDVDRDYPFRATRCTPDGVQIEEHQFQTLDEAKAFAADKLTNIPAHYALVRDINNDRAVWDSRS